MNKCICLALELQMNQILILYSDKSESHPVVKMLKAYLREIYLHMWKEKTQSIKNKPTNIKDLGYVIGASTCLAGVVLNKDLESWVALKDKWSNKDNAWKYAEEETRYFCGTESRPCVLKWGTHEYLGFKGFGR